MFIKILGNLNRVTSDYSRSVGFTPATGLYYTSPANSVFFWQVVSPEHHLYLGCLEKSRAQHGSFWFKLLALRFGSLKGTMKLLGAIGRGWATDCHCCQFPCFFCCNMFKGRWRHLKTDRSAAFQAGYIYIYIYLFIYI